MFRLWRVRGATRTVIGWPLALTIALQVETGRWSWLDENNSRSHNVCNRGENSWREEARPWSVARYDVMQVIKWGQVTARWAWRQITPILPGYERSKIPLTGTTELGRVIKFKGKRRKFLAKSKTSYLRSTEVTATLVTRPLFPNSIFWCPYSKLAEICSMLSKSVQNLDFRNIVRSVYDIYIAPELCSLFYHIAIYQMLREQSKRFRSVREFNINHT